MDLEVLGGSPLQGQLEVPADKSILHRALMLAAIAEPGTSSTIRALLPGEDNLSTAEVMRSLGATIEHKPGGTGPIKHDVFVVHGIGINALRNNNSGSTPTTLYCGNSGTTMRLLSGLLAGAGVHATLEGDASLTKRPMARVTLPLRNFGATIQGVVRDDGKETAPITIGPQPPGDGFCGGHYESPIASAQVKSALLLAGLTAGRDVTIHEPAPSRDHSERILRALGYACQNGAHGENAHHRITHTDASETDIEAPQSLAASRVARQPHGPMAALHMTSTDSCTAHEGFSLSIPGDISSAAFALTAALITPESNVTVMGVGLNPTRSGLLDIFEEMNAGAVVSGWRERQGEATGNIQCKYATALRVPEPELRVGGDIIPRLIDELVVLTALFDRAPGEVIVCDARELRVKESDRISEIERLLSAFGRRIQTEADGFSITGRGRENAARTKAPGATDLHTEIPKGVATNAIVPDIEIDVSSDHRVALTALVLALAYPGKTLLRGFDIAAVSYPSVIEDFRSLGARLTIR